jgi:hypothetical protein
MSAFAVRSGNNPAVPIVALRYCEVGWTREGAVTVFHDGSEAETYPHQVPHYSVIAHRLGYGDELLRYCQEHDFFHSFCEEYFRDRPSPVLWGIAHGSSIAISVAAYEELVVQACQRWVRANERPIVGGVDWGGFKSHALALLDRLNGGQPQELRW